MSKSRPPKLVNVATPQRWQSYLRQFYRYSPPYIAVAAKLMTNELAERCGDTAPMPRGAALLLHLHGDAERVADVVLRCSLRQQVISQLATELEIAGLLARAPHQVDGRARQLCLTAAGRRFATRISNLIALVEQGYEQLVGKRALKEFKSDVAQLYQHFVLDGVAATLPPQAALFLHLTGLANHCRREQIEAARAAGYRDLKHSFSQVFDHVSPHGTLFSDVVRANFGATQQTISQVVKQLEQLGYIERRTHPADRRASVLLLTSSGITLVDASLRIAARLDNDFCAALGGRRTTSLVKTIVELFGEPARFALLNYGSADALAPHAILQRTLERAYREWSTELRTVLFQEDKGRAKLSATALKALRELRIASEE